MKRKYQAGDTVEIVNNESGGFRDGKVVKVSRIEYDQESWQNLVLTDGEKTFLHICDEVRLVEE